jgi:hypothetical protein
MQMHYKQTWKTSLSKRLRFAVNLFTHIHVEQTGAKNANLAMTRTKNTPLNFNKQDTLKRIWAFSRSG